MEEKIFMYAVGIIFLALQFVFRMDSRKIVDAINLKVESGIKSFDDHVVESTEIHTMVESLEKLHDVKDAEGRNLIYTPPSMIAMQKEIVEVMKMNAQNQKATIRILERLERKIEAKGESHGN